MATGVSIFAKEEKHSKTILHEGLRLKDHQVGILYKFHDPVLLLKLCERKFRIFSPNYFMLNEFELKASQYHSEL